VLLEGLGKLKNPPHQDSNPLFHYVTRKFDFRMVVMHNVVCIFSCWPVLLGVPYVNLYTTFVGDEKCIHNFSREF
jgi:uncharacterized membrane protein